MMKIRLIILFVILLLALTACSSDKPKPASEEQQQTGGLILVKGGAVKDKKSNFYGKDITLSNFYIGKYEVTQKEWTEVMGSNPSQYKGDNLPVEMITWYDAVTYCNQRSLKEGLEPYYNIDSNQKDPENKSETDTMKWTVTVNANANGYRLPTEAEWEYAAGGGQMSKGYTYSGSSKAEDVTWYWRNAGDKYLSGDWNWGIIESNHAQTKAVGLKKPNELGLYDMSGNVREWCWDWYVDAKANINSGAFRVVKGGGWIGDSTSSEVSFRGKFEPNGLGPDQGFRVCRSE